MTREEFARQANVSRETLARLESYAELLEKWNRRINLVGRGTIDDLWRRHMLDSAQLLPLIPESAESLVDLGSGAGFPGLVLAICGVKNVHLIESDRKKCAFLREASRETGAPVTIHNKRIEEIESFQADVVTARALAPLPKLLDMAAPFAKKHCILLFLKGKHVDRELTDATKGWNMRVDRIPSHTDPEGTILRLEAISRALLSPEERR
ncbi:MAG: 16S rRNA (guanine(527)-N(7))-methyltransferase RsmG [Proteobacteria bacterium]|nr:16S rRNA (guanine(527)-N(7))-methyltransferase RsmG [Pseudomonadota bacterium]